MSDKKYFAADTADIAVSELYKKGDDWFDNLTT